MGDSELLPCSGGFAGLATNPKIKRYLRQLLPSDNADITALWLILFAANALFSIASGRAISDILTCKGNRVSLRKPREHGQGKRIKKFSLLEGPAPSGPQKETDDTEVVPPE